MKNIVKTIAVFALLIMISSTTFAQTELTGTAECSIIYADGRVVSKCIGIPIYETECEGYACGNISDYEISLKIAAELGIRLDDGKVEKFLWNGNKNSSMIFEFKYRY